MKVQVGKIKHGKSKHPLDSVWRNMIYRCYNEKSTSYRFYGARGIAVCDQWKNDFMNFYNWAVDNGWVMGLQLDRIKSSGDYEPSNCRWATVIQQQRNKGSNKRLNFNGEMLTLKEISEKTGIPYSTLAQRYYTFKWPIEKLVLEPSHKNRVNKWRKKSSK